MEAQLFSVKWNRWMKDQFMLPENLWECYLNFMYEHHNLTCKIAKVLQIFTKSIISYYFNEIYFINYNLFKI